MVIAVISGAAWDLSGIPRSRFVPLAACAVGLIAIPVALRRKNELV